jgi:hypothetical protein
MKSKTKRKTTKKRATKNKKKSLNRQLDFGEVNKTMRSGSEGIDYNYDDSKPYSVEDVKYKSKYYNGRKLYYNENQGCYSARVQSSHVTGLRYFPTHEVIQVQFHDNSIYSYECGYYDLFTMFARIVTGELKGSVGHTFWELLRRKTTEYQGNIRYTKTGAKAFAPETSNKRTRKRGQLGLFG